MIHHHIDGIEMSEHILHMTMNEHIRKEAHLIIESQSNEVFEMRYTFFKSISYQKARAIKHF